MNEKIEGLDTGKLKPTMNFGTDDFVLALAMVLCGFIYWSFLDTPSMGLGISVFALILCSITLYYFRTKSVNCTKASLLWLVIIGVSAVQFALFDGAFIKLLNLIFLSICFIYWVAVSAGGCMKKGLSIYTVWDFVNQIFMVPFLNISCEYFGLKYGFSKSKHSKNIKYMLLGFIVFLPIMVFVIGQLSSADAAFETLIDKLWILISAETLLRNMIHFIVGIPVACYLFGLIYGNVVCCNTQRVSEEGLNNWVRKISFAPRITVYTVLIAFNIIYVVFFATQGAYFLSAFKSVLPDSFTYAEYARRGFFELCRVSAVNMVLIALAHIFIAKGTETKEGAPKMLRVQTGILSIMTIGLIVTALSKMYMYIESYGLTQLRVYTSWFMVMLLLAFSVILLRQIKDFNASRIVIVGSILGFMLLSYGNVDGNIAKYNIEGYENGKLEKIDYQMLMGLSDGAVPHLYELYKKTEDGTIKYELYWRLVSGTAGAREYSYQNRSIKSFNLQSERASSISGLLQSEGPPR